MHARARYSAGLLTLAFALATVPTLSSAQQRATRALSVGLGGGGTVPLGDFANDVKTGWNGLAHVQYQPAGGGPWAVRAEAQYSGAKYTDDFLGAVGASPGDNLTNNVLSVGASALYHLSGRDGSVRPYLIGGLGLYRLTASLKDGSGLTVSDSENGFGFSGGAGLRFGGPVGVFVEARFHQFSVTPKGGDKSTSRFIPVSIGVAF